MNGELAQIIALVAHGNWFLSKNGGVSPPDLQQTNSTFQYTSSVVFARYQDRDQQQGEIVAGSVPEWFLLLRSVGVQRLWNVAFAWQNSGLQEYEAAAFAGGVPRAIQADLPHGFELWYPRWGTGGPSQKPWTVEYRSLAFPHSHAPPMADLEGIKLQLRRAIQQAVEFARRPGIQMERWPDWLSRAIPLLDDASPTPVFHGDMLPAEGYSLAARQLLAAATQADVFGGMGSWNDVAFADKGLETEYRKITDQLYEAVKFATVMVPNSFFEAR